MAIQSEHTRRVLTRAGYKNIVVNPGVRRASRTESKAGERPSLQGALSQLGGESFSGGNTSSDGVSGGVPGADRGKRIAAKASLVMAITGQEERIAATAYNFREIADDLASGKISLEEAQSRSRSTLVEMEMHMAAVEYAAARISPELAETVLDNHELIREQSVDTIGYLVDMEDSTVFLDDDVSAAGFKTAGADPLYDSTRTAAENLHLAAAQEVAAQLLPEAVSELESALRDLNSGDPDSMLRYRQAEEDMHSVAKQLQEFEQELTDSGFQSDQLLWAVEDVSRVVHGGSKDAAVNNLWAAVNSYQSSFGLNVE